MNYFVAISRRSGSQRPMTHDDLEPWLPVPAVARQHWRSGSGRTELFTYQPDGEASALPPCLSSPDVAMAVDGIASTDVGHTRAEQTLADLRGRVSRATGESPLSGLHGEFAAVWCSDAELQATSVSVGCNPIYYLVTDDLVAVANRQSLLLPLHAGRLELDPVGLGWLCYQGYIQQDASPFLPIRRLPPGAVLRVGPSSRPRIDQPRASYLPEDSEELGAAEMRSLLEKCADELIAGLAYAQSCCDDRSWILPLSGGKDSRLILALLAAAGQLDTIESCFTSGPLYAPDVIAAQELCRTLGIQDKHTVRRPPLVSAGRRAFEEATTTAMLMTEGRVSIFDTVGIPPPRSTIQVTGHQNGLRDSYFAKCPTTTLEQFLECASSVHFHDPLGLLEPGLAEQMRQRYRGIFVGYADQGVPLTTLGDAYMVGERNANWVGVINNTARSAGPSVNPLLSVPLVRTAFALSPAARRAEFLHFELTRLAAPELLDIPFADDRWSPGLEKFVGPGIVVPVRAPYRSHQSFPSQSNRYISNFKIELAQGLRPLMLSFLERHRGRLEGVVDNDAARSALSSFETGSVGPLICGFGLYTALLLCEYGSDLFHRERRLEVAKDLRERMTQCELTAPGAVPSDDAEDQAEPEAAMLLRHSQGLERIQAACSTEMRSLGLTAPAERCVDTPSGQSVDLALRNYEDAIATVVVELQRVEGLARSSSSDEFEEVWSPPPTSAWRAKLRKLRRRPGSFFSDSRHVILRGIGRAFRRPRR